MIQSEADATLAMQMARIERALCGKLRREIPTGPLLDGSIDYEKWRVAEDAALRASRLESLGVQFCRDVAP